MANPFWIDATNAQGGCLKSQSRTSAKEAYPVVRHLGDKLEEIFLRAGEKLPAESVRFCL